MDLSDLVGGLVRHRDLGGAAHDEVRLDGHVSEQFQEPDPVNHAGGAADAYD
jgi:hypothetical protein